MKISIIRITIFIVSIAITAPSAGQDITVDNAQAHKVFGAVYWVKGKSNDGKPGSISRATADVTPLGPFSTTTLPRPARDWYSWYGIPRWYDRDLYIAGAPDSLQKTI